MLSGQSPLAGACGASAFRGKQPCQGYIASKAERQINRSDAGHGSNRTTILMEQDENPGSTGSDGTYLDVWRHRFDSLEIGTDIYRNEELVVAPMQRSCALLGADFLWRMPMWISYRERAVVLFRRNTSVKTPQAGSTVQTVPAIPRVGHRIQRSDCQAAGSASSATATPCTVAAIRTDVWICSLVRPPSRTACS